MASSVIFIPSKGRPWCQTAKYLDDIGYDSDVFIVVGDDDETRFQYEEIWGSEKVVVFDKAAAALETDMMDAFGPDKATGVAPARNEIVGIARAMRLDRCWLMDDDYESLCVSHSNGVHEKVMDGARLHMLLDQMEDFGRITEIPVVGFKEGPSGHKHDEYGHRVYCAHNISTDTRLFNKFSGRMLDDSVHASRQLREGRADFLFYHMYVKQADKPYAYNKSAGEQKGGMAEAYGDPDAESVAERQALVRCRYIGYNVIQSPNGVTGTFNGLRVTPKDLDDKMCPKIIRWRYVL